MKVTRCLVMLLLGLVGALPAQECRPAKTALVLSGGGAKGLAHIGVLHVLDSLGVRPDLIVGTSMGAIVGALYASGYTARQIDSLARSLPISEVVSRFRTPAPHPWDQRLPILFMVRGQHGFAFQTGVVDETQPNARLNAAMLRGNLLARGRFDRLPIPFLAVATDLRDRRTVVLSDGDLARAVRASSAIPLIFPPVVVGEAILVDGGLSANIPVLEARAAGAERVIVSDVTERAASVLDVESPLALADQLVGFLFQQPFAPVRPGDVMIRPEVQGFRSLDFSPATVETILRRGRLAADTTMARAQCLERAPPLITPDLPGTLSGWRVTNGSATDSTLVARMLRLDPGTPLVSSRLRERLIGLADAEALRGVWLNPTGTADTVSFDIEPIRSPSTVGGAGAAYDHEMGLRGWAGLFDRRMFGTTLEGSGLLSFGRFQQELYAAALWHFDAGWSRLTPITTLRIRTENLRQFRPNGVEAPLIGTSEAHLKAAVEFRIDESWRVKLGADGLAWGGEATRGKSGFGGSARFERNGRSGPQMVGETIITSGFQSVGLTTDWPVEHRGFRLLPKLRFGYGGTSLPRQRTWVLGGDEGFPGLHLGEMRGSREAFASLRASHSIKGPIEVRLTVAAGRAWSPDTPSPDWLTGARLGFGASTPAGPIDVAYGVTTTGRHALYLRLGQWF